MGQRSRIEGTQDAIALLLEDHRRLATMFADYEALAAQDGADDDKGRLSAQLCAELALHMQIEEEVFYPALRAALGDEDLFDGAEGEHRGTRDLMRQLECMEADDRRYDAKVKLLGERAVRHFGDEEDEVLPRASRAQLDFAGLAQAMLALRRELLAEMKLAEAPGVEDGMRAAREAAHDAGKTASGARR
jgi:hypothetical protein